jgi:hypothetical protein
MPVADVAIGTAETSHKVVSGDVLMRSPGSTVTVSERVHPVGLEMLTT